MNQMGKVPLLTREQEVEICKRIEEAELEMKRLVYSLGFTAKEHIAIAEKLLSEPPKERFDRVVVDKKVANREGHLRDLRALDQEGPRARTRGGRRSTSPGRRLASKGRREKLAREFQKLDKKLQDDLPEVLLQAEGPRGHDRRGRQRPREIQGQPAAHPGTGSPAQIRQRARQQSNAERAKIRTLEQFVRMPREEFYKSFDQSEARRRPRAPGQDPHGRGQPAPRGFRRQEIHQPRPVVPRPDPGRQHRPDERRREVRISPRLQVLHLRHLVDSPGHHPLHCRPGPHHPHPGAHDRNHEQALARPKAAHPGTGPRAHARKRSPTKCTCRSRASMRCSRWPSSPSRCTRPSATTAT